MTSIYSACSILKHEINEFKKDYPEEDPLIYIQILRKNNNINDWFNQRMNDSKETKQNNETKVFEKKMVIKINENKTNVRVRTKRRVKTNTITGRSHSTIISKDIISEDQVVTTTEMTNDMDMVVKRTNEVPADLSIITISKGKSFLTLDRSQTFSYNDECNEALKNGKIKVMIASGSEPGNLNGIGFKDILKKMMDNFHDVFEMFKRNVDNLKISEVINCDIPPWDVVHSKELIELKENYTSMCKELKIKEESLPKLIDRYKKIQFNLLELKKYTDIVILKYKEWKDWYKDSISESGFTTTIKRLIEKFDEDYDDNDSIPSDYDN
jgi:hypothetical protein